MVLIQVVLLYKNAHDEIKFIPANELLRGKSLWTPVTFTTGRSSIFKSLFIGSSSPKKARAADSERRIDEGSANPFQSGRK